MLLFLFLQIIQVNPVLSPNTQQASQLSWISGAVCYVILDFMHEILALFFKEMWRLNYGVSHSCYIIETTIGTLRTAREITFVTV